MLARLQPQRSCHGQCTQHRGLWHSVQGEEIQIQNSKSMLRGPDVKKSTLFDTVFDFMDLAQKTVQNS